jgi:hypothetical protein
MDPTQNAQFQLTTDINPDTTGPRMGPKVVAAYALISLQSQVTWASSSTMKTAILLPRAIGSCQISAQIPPIPTRSLNTTSAAKFGATALAIEKIVKRANEYTMMPLRP